MGATPVPSADIGRFARDFEASGWDGLAVGEAHGLLPDPYVVLALAAAATTTLKVGTAVAVPLRHPLLAADAMATLQGVSGGRASFSIGRGDGAMKVLQQKPMPVARFEEYLLRLQGFLRREDVEIDGVVSTMSRLDDIDPSLDAARPMLNVAATGPRTIDVAVRLADGVSFSVGADVERLRQSIALARDACHAAGRDPDSLGSGATCRSRSRTNATRVRARRFADSSSRTRASPGSRRPQPPASPPPITASTGRRWRRWRRCIARPAAASHASTAAGRARSTSIRARPERTS
jgi:5,10-methylenetetrahydromethanopterin reductase